MKTFLALALTSACLAPAGAQTPDPPPVVSRAEFDAKFASLDARIARLEAAVLMGLRATAPPPPVIRSVVTTTTAPSAPAVVAVAPFVPGATGRATTAPLAVGTSASRSVGLGVTLTRTAAAPTVSYGGITTVSGCANGQCGTTTAYTYAPFGGRFRLR